MEISFLEVSPEQKTSSPAKQSTIAASEGDSPFAQVFRHIFSEQTSEQAEVSPENSPPVQEITPPLPEAIPSETEMLQDQPSTAQLEMPLVVSPPTAVDIEGLAGLIAEDSIEPNKAHVKVDMPAHEGSAEAIPPPETPTSASELTLPVIQSLLFQMALRHKSETKTEEGLPLKQNDSAESASNSNKTAAIIAQLEAVYLMPKTDLSTASQISVQPSQTVETQTLPSHPPVQTSEEIPLPEIHVQVDKSGAVPIPSPQPGSNSGLRQFLQWMNQQLSYLSQMPPAYQQLALKGSTTGLDSALLTPFGSSDLASLPLGQNISPLIQKSPNLESLKTSSSPPEAWRAIQPELSGHPSQTQLQNHHQTSLEASRPGPLMHQIVQNLRYLHQHQRSEIRLALDPPQLGRMMLQFIQQPDGLMQLHMVLEQGLAKEMVEASLGQLRQQFQQHNLQIDQIIIETRQSFDQDTSHSEQQFEEPAEQTKTQSPDNLLAELREDESINQELLVNLSPYINYLV